MKVCLDLCCGKGGGTQSFRGQTQWHVIGVDNDRKFAKFWVGERLYFILADVTAIDWQDFKEEFGIPHVEFLWASPPCQHFSLASVQFPRKGIRRALEVVGSCFEAIAVLKPKYWLVENPRARLRHILGKPKQTIRYSDYDGNYPTQKPTDLWSNLPLPMVKAERKVIRTHGLNYLQRLHLFAYMYPKKNEDRAFVPKGVSDAVFESVERRLLEAED